MADRKNNRLNKIIDILSNAGGRPMLVGGCVRDGIMGIESKDVDIEVYGLSIEDLYNCLAPFKPKMVGKSFGVIMVDDFDISLPRRDSKVPETTEKKGHRAFDISTDPNMSFTEAASRRDFTINAILEDALTGEIIDPHNGIRDIKQKVIRHVDAGHFGEDSLRVLRAVQFSARFGFDIAAETVELCRSIDLTDLPKERIREEIFKLLVKGKSLLEHGIPALIQTGAIRIFPEISDMLYCGLDPEIHSEQHPRYLESDREIPQHNALVHTAFALQHAADNFAFPSDNDRFRLMLGILCHHMDKPDTSRHVPGNRQTEETVLNTKSFLSRLTNSKELMNSVLALVENQLSPLVLADRNVHPPLDNSSFKIQHSKFLRRLVLRVNIDELLLLAEADMFATHSIENPRQLINSTRRMFHERMDAIGIRDSVPEPIIQGHDLISEGMKQGQELGRILKELFERQLDGEFDTLEGGLKVYRELYEGRDNGERRL